jgi:PHP family Zn ribbon phosphoesterase
MSPRKIAARVSERSLDIVAICDHNSAENVPAVMKAAGAGRVVVLPGMEVCTSEEIHVLAIFEDLDRAFAMQATVYDHLRGENNPDVFGLQVVANEHDEVVALQTRLLIGAVDLPVDRILDDIHRLGGLAIASHIDRGSYSVISQLGFIPGSLKFDALELSSRMPDREARERFPSGGSVVFVRNSDAHFLNDVGKHTSEYLLREPTFAEMRKALKKEEGRMVMELT